MKKFVLNLKDESGCIKTGYEETLEGSSREEVITDYLNYHTVHTDINLTAEDVDCVEVDWE